MLGIVKTAKKQLRKRFPDAAQANLGTDCRTRRLRKLKPGSARSMRMALGVQQ